MAFNGIHNIIRYELIKLLFINLFNGEFILIHHFPSFRSPPFSVYYHINSFFFALWPTLTWLKYNCMVRCWSYVVLQVTLSLYEPSISNVLTRYSVPGSWSSWDTLDYRGIFSCTLSVRPAAPKCRVSLGTKTSPFQWFPFEDVAR